MSSLIIKSPSLPLLLALELELELAVCVDISLDVHDNLDIGADACAGTDVNCDPNCDKVVLLQAVLPTVSVVASDVYVDWFSIDAMKLLIVC